MSKSHKIKTCLRWSFRVLLVLILVGVLAIAWLFRPLSLPPLTSTPQPAATYAEAQTKFEKIQSDEATLSLHEGGRSILLTHGYQTEYAFVLLHGLTNSPRQFRKLGEILFSRGANVVIPRLAYHGFADRLTDAHAALRAEDLIHQVDEGIDIACGLGKRVIVVGLSVSGASTAWIAQHRDDVDTACLLAPFLGLPGIPDGFTGAASRLLLRLPNKVMWWDPRVREKIAGPPTNYPRFATRPLGEVLRIGMEAEAWTEPLKVRRLVVVLSESDLAINNARARRLASQWCAQSPQTECSLHVFPRGDDVIHDFIDPQQPRAQIEKVYPQLLEWILPEAMKKVQPQARVRRASRSFVWILSNPPLLKTTITSPEDASFTVRSTIAATSGSYLASFPACRRSFATFSGFSRSFSGNCSIRATFANITPFASAKAWGKTS